MVIGCSSRASHLRSSASKHAPSAEVSTYPCLKVSSFEMFHGRDVRRCVGGQQLASIRGE
jgi:hypothetical protein